MSLAPDERPRPSDARQTVTAAPAPTPHAARVLVVTTLGWPSTARLALALFEAGARVEAISPPGHALRRIACVQRTYVHPVGGAAAALRKEIEASACDLLVAGDDRAAAHLRQLHAIAAGEDGQGLRALIERSLGASEHYALHASRARLMIAAREAGLRAPLTSVVDDPADLARFFAENGAPAVLKADGSWGGSGVAFAKDVKEAISAFNRLAAPPSVVRVLKRRLMDGETLDAWPWRRRQRRAVSVQAYVPGRPANVAVACWEGVVLAQTTLEAVRTSTPSGPATVVRRIDHPEISQVSRRLVEALGLSGLCGFDFVLDNDGAAHLIELNARATPTAHLASLEGPSPTDFLIARAANRRVIPSDLAAAFQAKPGELIALFPQEIQRDPTSSFIETARHDLPTRSPELIALGYASARRHGLRRRSGGDPDHSWRPELVAERS
jgi:hypothetical protein